MIDSTRRFNVYILFRLDKPKGEYIYGTGENQIKFDFEPFYVGHGRKRRAIDHFSPRSLKESLKGRNAYKQNIIISLLENFKRDDIIHTFKSNLLKKEARDLETLLIKTIGRNDLKSGPLTNLTDGGEGEIGQVFTEERREKLRIANSGINHPMYGKPKSEETKNKISASKRGKCSGSENPFFGKKHDEAQILKMKLVSTKHTYKAISPIGEIFDNILLIKDFCKENKLNYSKVHQTAKGKFTNHKGWIFYIKGKEHLRKNINEGGVAIKPHFKYQISSPSGDLFEIETGFTNFCRDRLLSPGSMRLVAYGKRPHHKGWKCKIIEVI